MVSAYSIGTSKRPKAQKSDVPAPNAYQPANNNKQQSPKWTIGGVGKRESIKIKSVTPGPGQYPTRTTLNEAPSFTFKGRTKEKNVSCSPGPGNYNEESFQSVRRKVPSHSMGVKLDKILKQFGPGPGTYNMNKTFQSAQSCKFSIEKRLKTMDDRINSPGPGQYSVTNYDKFSSHKSQPQWRFGSKGNQKLHQSLDMSVPGPGMYDMRSTLTQQNFTLKPKLKIVEGDFYRPGPGQYSPEVKLIKSAQPAFSMGKESRQKIQRLSTEPGPGNYYKEGYDRINKTSQPCFRMSKAQRSTITENQSSLVPGPGTYDIPKKKLGNITLKGVNQILKDNQVPGPGKYSPKDDLCHSNDGTVKIAAEVRKIKSPLSKEQPGPGTYDYKSILMGPRWGFGKAQKRKQYYHINTSPGPGAYDVPSMIADVPKYLNCKQKQY